ncbi:hypothetical protein L873DRAFT_1790860 [Choiromyces venosus 120613-1]|uniref:Uncharacterized protein n=1 Tax=Choiromyces venosus 120613-1 TaxID=1336337 RepID=A0A3N4JKI6_9PEZI|nr:hypothetical protein L873DRAFT_1790860 [Choiromyces venosus 120613-1]
MVTKSCLSILPYRVSIGDHRRPQPRPPRRPPRTATPTLPDLAKPCPPPPTTLPRDRTRTSEEVSSPVPRTVVSPLPAYALAPNRLPFGATSPALPPPPNPAPAGPNSKTSLVVQGVPVQVAAVYLVARTSPRSRSSETSSWISDGITEWANSYPTPANIHFGFAVRLKPHSSTNGIGNSEIGPLTPALKKTIAQTEYQNKNGIGNAEVPGPTNTIYGHEPPDRTSLPSDKGTETTSTVPVRTRADYGSNLSGPATEAEVPLPRQTQAGTAPSNPIAPVLREEQGASYPSRTPGVPGGSNTVAGPLRRAGTKPPTPVGA